MKTILILALAATACAQSVTISAPVFTGAGLNDATSGGAFTALPTNAAYVVAISATGTPDSFKWQKSGGVLSAAVPITGSAQTLADGVTIRFAATTGHTLLDAWLITANAHGSLAAVNTIQSGVGAKMRTAEAKARDVVSVFDFGADSTGSADSSPAFSSAITSLAAGGTVLVPPGNYKISSATVSIPDSVCVQGFGSGPSILNGTGAFPTVTILDAQNPCLRNVTVKSVNDGILLKTTAVSHPTIYPLIENVNVSTVGDTYAGIHVTNTACCVYFASFANVNIDGGVAAPLVGTRSGYLFDGSAGFNIRPVITGGRVVNVKYGFNLTSMSSGFVWGTELDGETTGTGSGIGLWAKTGVGFNQFNLRMEGSGTGGSIDKYWQFDAGSTRNWIMEIGYAGSTSSATDAGTLNCVFGGDGSGGLTNYCLNPQIMGNLTIPSTYTFSMPGTTNGQFATGGPAATSAQMAGVGAVSTMSSPNSSFGYPLALIGDSSGRSGYWASHDFNGSVGTNCQLITPPGSSQIPQLLCGVNGSSASAPYLDTGTMGEKETVVPFSAIGSCVAGTTGVRRLINDANTAVFNAVVAGGGAGIGYALCDGTVWRLH